MVVLYQLLCDNGMFAESCYHFLRGEGLRGQLDYQLGRRVVFGNVELFIRKDAASPGDLQVDHIHRAVGAIPNQGEQLWAQSPGTGYLAIGFGPFLRGKGLPLGVGMV
jgi:hypothetical protein